MAALEEATPTPTEPLDGHDPAPGAEPSVHPQEWLRAEAQARVARRQELILHAATAPGWRMLESEFYFILTDIDDQPFLDELASRADAFRTHLVTYYPPNTPLGGANTPSLTVLRIFSTQSGYRTYGGPARATGHFYHPHRELVFFRQPQDQHSGGTWAVLQGLLGFDYMGSTLELEKRSMPLWIMAGLPDYWSGLQLQEDGRYRFVADPKGLTTLARDWNKDSLTSLGKLFRPHGAAWNPDDVVASNAWALVLFLEETGGEGLVWEESWSGILGRYIECAMLGGEPSSCLAEGLRGVRPGDLEVAWRMWVERALLRD